jgi:PhnB protein
MSQFGDSNTHGKGVAMAAKPIPDNYPRVTPYLAIDGAAAAIDFYRKAFGATECMRMGGPGGKIGHAEKEMQKRAAKLGG